MKVKLNSTARGKEWLKGDIGILVKHIGGIIYLVEVNGYEVWVTKDEFTPWNQLTLFDDLP